MLKKGLTAVQTVFRDSAVLESVIADPTVIKQELEGTVVSYNNDLYTMSLGCTRVRISRYNNARYLSFHKQDCDGLLIDPKKNYRLLDVMKKDLKSAIAAKIQSYLG